jgi:hypothetical protein
MEVHTVEFTLGSKKDHYDAIGRGPLSIKKCCRGSLNFYKCFDRRSQLSLKSMKVGDLPGSIKVY